MSEAVSAEEIGIRTLLGNRADAVRRYDLPAVLAYHEPDILMFDLPPPLQCKEMVAYEQTWGLFFRYHEHGTEFDSTELAVDRG
jgi:ketosteroid isomerase-like protein